MNPTSLSINASHGVIDDSGRDPILAIVKGFLVFLEELCTRPVLKGREGQSFHKPLG